MSKLTLEEVRERGLEKGFTLLSDVYINSKQKLSWLCPKGHLKVSALGDIQTCSKCTRLEYVNDIALSRGFKLISEYTGALNKAKYQCQDGHEFFIRFNNIKNGQGCPHCAGNKKLTIEEVRARGLMRGFELISTEYINSLTPLLWLCPKKLHHTKKMLTSIEAKQECLECSKRAPLTIEGIRAKGLSLGLELISESLSGPLKWRCTNGHEFYKRPSSPQYGCLACSGSAKYTLESVTAIGLKAGFELLSDEYINAHSPLKWKCSQGHITSKVFNEVRRGQGCGVCSKTHDKAQKELYQYVLGLSPDAVYNKSGLLKSSRLELDVYIPSLRKAIELDGEYWHSQSNSIERDLRKDKECQEAGIELLRLGYNKHWKSGIGKKMVVEFLK